MRTWLLLAPLVAVIASGCAPNGTATSAAGSLAADPTGSMTSAPSETTSLDTNPPSDALFEVALTGNFGDDTLATIIDRTGLVSSAEAASTAVIPFEPHLLPAAVNPASDRRALVVYWGQLKCRRATDLTDETLGGGLLVTVAPRGDGDCDTIGSTFALRLDIDRELMSADVAVRQVREGTGDIQWVARSPVEPGATVTVIDRALALAGAALDIPPRLTPGITGIAQARNQRHVSVAWHEPCGAESDLVLDGTPAVPRLAIGWVMVEPCEGTRTREVTLVFVDERGAESLSIQLDSTP